MGIADDVKEKCISQLEAEFVQCIDNSDDQCDGAKLDMIIVSKQFEGVSLLKRHQKVNDLVAEELADNRIHAITMKTWTPEQYEKKKSKAAAST